MGLVVEVCSRRALNADADMSKVMVLGGEEGSICGILVDEHISEFKYLGCV